MPEDVLFEFEQSMNRAEIAAYLRSVADRLEAGDTLSLDANGQSVTLAPPARPTFEVKAERESGSGPDEVSVEFELEWDEGQGQAAEESDGLTIE